MEWLLEQVRTFLANWWQSIIFSMADGSIGLILDVSDEFWESSVIIYLLDFSSWANGVVMAVSLLFLVVDVVEEAGSRGVDWGAVYSNLFKALIFVFTNRWIALYSLQIGNLIIRNIDLKSELRRVNDSIAETVAMTVSGQFIWRYLFLVLMLVIASGIFYFVSLRRFGAMLLHIFTSSFYIADIVRGDTSKMGDWIRQTIAIACTFTFQYLLYYVGILYYGKLNISISIACWISIPLVTRTLQRFGFSTGTSGAVGAAGRMAGQGLARVILK